MSGNKWLPRIATLLALTVWGLAGCSTIDTASSSVSMEMHIFVLAGQSNMSGRGAVGEIDRTAHPRIFVMNANDEWVTAVEPLHFDKPRIAGVGPGLAFAKEVADKNPDIRIGLVPTAVGGSPIQTWTPGAIHEGTGLHPWDDAVRRLQLAKQAGELKAVLWHQGEGDSGAGRAPFYEERLHDLIRRFRAAAGDDNLPFIVGQLSQTKDWSEGRHIVNKAHASVPDKIPNTLFVSSDGLTDKGDGTHFDAASARELGRRYAAAYAQLQTESQ